MQIDLTKISIPGFFSRIKKTNTCWVWTGGKSDKGYGLLQYVGIKSYPYPTLVKAHRVSWTIHYGAIPQGLLVCHSCDNPPCVRPDHLWIGTCKENIRDSVKKGRWDHRKH